MLKASLRVNRGASYKESIATLKQMRSKYYVTNDNIPALLRDIFEIFVETHNSKQFLKKFDFVDDLQKRAIRSSLLKACALCGPDGELRQSEKVTSKFLDLSKITNDDYTLEGINIGIKWYVGVLDHSGKNKKD